MGDPDEIGSSEKWADQRSRFDALRAMCPVVHEDGSWVVLRHAEVVAAATDARTFSSRVTSRRAIPNSLDGADHAAYRAVVDRYLTDERVARDESQCRSHAAAIVDALPRGATVKTIATTTRPPDRVTAAGPRRSPSDSTASSGHCSRPAGAAIPELMSPQSSCSTPCTAGR